MSKEIEAAIGKVANQFWPRLPVVPAMSPAATDSSFLRNAGIASYGFDGLLTDLADFRVHGNDERVSVKSFAEGHAALYQLIKIPIDQDSLRTVISCSIACRHQ